MLEETDEAGDIIDSDGFNKLADIRGNALDLEPNLELVLVKTIWDVEMESVDYRAWAYVKNGALPANFTNAAGAETDKVPQRLIKEFNAYKLKHGSK